MKRAIGLGLFFVVMFTGCDARRFGAREAEKKLNSPTPDYATRHMMPCPKCAAPQRPYRITQHKSYYQCSGMPPKFVYHPTVEWEHDIRGHKFQTEQ